jgi:microcystin-dependent protein
VNLTSNRLLGQNIGEETHTLIINEMPAHKHGATAVSGNNNGSGDTSSYTHDHGGTTGLGGYAATSTSVQVPISGTNVADDNGAGHNHSITADTHTHTIANTGGGAAHNNMQPTLFIGNMFIYSGKAMAGTYTYF